MNRTFYSINWKDKKYFVVSETETYLLVSANGKDFTERQRIKRKIERLKNKISALPIHERQAVIDAMQTIDVPGSIDK